jgi:hypothetical protein
LHLPVKFKNGLSSTISERHAKSAIFARHLPKFCWNSASRKNLIAGRRVNRNGTALEILNPLYMGRPPILPKKKKDGFYIEIRNKGAKSGTIIIRDSEQAMLQAAKQYETTKDVIILGKHENGKRVDDSPKKKTKA